MRVLLRLGLAAWVCALAGCGTGPPGAPRRGGASAADAAALNARAEALAHYSAAFIADVENHPAEALAHFQATADLDSRQVPLALHLGLIYLVNRNYTNAITLLERVRREDPASFQVVKLLGYAYEKADQPGNALREYDRLLRLAPELPDGYVKSAEMAAELRQPRRALALLEEALRHVSEPEAILSFYATLGRYYIANEEDELALRTFEALARHKPDDPDVREALAKLYMRTERPKKARGVLEQMVKRKPDDAALAIRLADACAAGGDMESAEQQFRVTSSNAPPQPEPYVHWAALYLQDRPDRAEQILREGLARMTNQPALLILLGLIHVNREEFKQAIAVFERTEQSLNGRVSVAVPAPVFYFWYGVACERDGQFERAVDLFEKHLVVYPKAHNALNYVAYMWAEKGLQLDKAREYVQRALQLDPDNPAYLDTLAWVEYRAGEYAKAREHIEQSLKQMPKDATILDHMGDILQALKREKEAIDYWQRSNRADPANAAVADKLRRCGAKICPVPMKRKEAEAN